MHVDKGAGLRVEGRPKSSTAHYLEIGGKFLVEQWQLVAGESLGMERPSRFAYLMEPIRDLTKNWEVDVASQLDEYLSEVRAPLFVDGCYKPY